MNFINSFKTLGYLIKRKPYRLEKPTVIQFPINDICNSGCSMCHIWKNKKDDEISPETLDKYIKNKLFDQVKVVGINGGEPTLRNDLPEIINVLFKNLPKLKRISLITNGYKVDQVISRIEESISAIKRHHGEVDLMVSLDGVGEIHNLVRGKKNYFANTEKVINHFKNHSNVDQFRIGCTIIKSNVYDLHNILDYCVDNGIYIKYRIGIPHKRLYTDQIQEPFELSKKEKQYLIEFLEGVNEHYETDFLQKITYKSIIRQLIDNRPRYSGCDWKHRGATISSSGEVLFCAVQSDTISMISDQHLFEKYFSNQEKLDDIIKNKCDSCIHDYNGIPEKIEIIKKIINSNIFLSKIDSIIFNYLTKRIRLSKRKNRLIKLSKKSSKKEQVKQYKFNVLICGWYGTETLGDKAILMGIMQNIYKVYPQDDCQIFVATLNEYISENTSSQISELMKAPRNLSTEASIENIGIFDAVILGGGPLMAINELVEIYSIFTSAKQKNVPRIIAGSGIGPWGGALHNDLIIKILNLSTTRIYRDTQSKDEAAKAGVDTKNDYVASDPSVAWLSQYAKSSIIASDKRVILLGLRSFPFKQYSADLPERDNVEISNRYINSIIESITKLLELHKDIVFKPIPMCTNHFGSDDRWFFKELLRKLPRSSRIDCSLLNQELSPREYVGEFSKATIILAMRFHSLVFSLALGKPVICIDYTRKKGKTYNLCESVHAPYSSIEELTAKFIINEIDAILRKPPKEFVRIKDTFSKVFTFELNKISEKNL